MREQLITFFAFNRNLRNKLTAALTDPPSAYSILPKFLGIEVKADSTVNQNDFKGLRLIADSLPKKFKRGIILYTGNQFLSFGKNLYLVPITALWN